MRKQGSIKSNPAGNITLFVFDDVDPANRSVLAERLMKEDPDVEQVAFVCPPTGNADGRIEMMGGEFCGNATRAFGLLLAQEEHLRSKSELLVECSGAVGPLKVTVDLKEHTSAAQMPVPLSIEKLEIQGISGTLVCLPGITHFVVADMEPDEKVLDRVESELKKRNPSDAYGICFLNLKTMSMTPLVDVLNTHSRTWEGSCGSGSVACACAQSIEEKDGVFKMNYAQPAGSILVTVKKENGSIQEASIGGTVTFD